MNLFELLSKYPDDETCRQHLEQIRWPDGVRCPRCGGDKIARLRKRKQFSCKTKTCNLRFSATTDTIFHASKIGLRKWFTATYIISNAKKSVSSLQLSRELNISAECCWHMTMRIREAMREHHAELFRGIVQADEFFHGGDPRHDNKHLIKHKRGRGTLKQPVLGAYENATGRLRTTVMPRNLTSKKIAGVLRKWVKVDGVELHTDQYNGYCRIGRLCKAHKRVNHKLEYVTADGTHCNAVENAWSLFNRSVIGSFHKISVKHLPRYLSEFDARFNARKENGSFFPRILSQCPGRRLPMKELVDGGKGAQSR